MSNPTYIYTVSSNADFEPTLRKLIESGFSVVKVENKTELDNL